MINILIVLALLSACVIAILQIVKSFKLAKKTGNPNCIGCCAKCNGHCSSHDHE